MATIYLDTAAHDQVAAAQAEFDAHTVSSGDGRCLSCFDSPCPGQAGALRILAQYGQLPRRRPGATRPDRIGLRPSGVSWFAR